ncbi:MAG TPA: YkvA family protein [Gemmatimonadaceae bacterium]|nr:YkvA family protein [Gemmatimonadaceae bacterium]
MSARAQLVRRQRERLRARIAERAGRSTRSARSAVLHTIRLLPTYLRMLGGLLRDRRVSALDKLLLAAAIAYVLSPLDFIPDVIPFLGQVDDIYLVVLAVQRLITNAGRGVVLDHWHAAPEELSPTALGAALLAAARFLPRRLRRRLRRAAARA